MGNLITSEFKYPIKLNTHVDGNKPLIVIYETDTSHAHLHKLVYTIEKNGFDYIILGSGDMWEWFGTKINVCHEFYKMLDPERIIIQLDARDTLVNQDYKQFIKIVKYYDNVLNNQLIASVTGRGWIPNYPPGSYFNGTERNKRATKYEPKSSMDTIEKWKKVFHDKYPVPVNKLNAGMILGRVKNFIKLYDIMKINNDENDQIVMYDVFYYYPELFKLDIENVFFLNILHYNQHDCNYTDAITSKDGIKSIFVQTPGQNWKCYNKLFDSMTN